MGGSENAIVLITDQGHDTWPRMTKSEVAAGLAAKIAAAVTAS
jgi:phosphopantothenoylcysteine decarboxylase/phosphopantothenate--cysteine ligase